MEALALSHSFVAYESPESELKLKSLDELGLKIPNSALVGLVGMAVAVSVVGLPGEAQASCGYRHCGGHHGHNGYSESSYGEREHHGHEGYREASNYGEREHHSRDGYSEVATNGSRLNIRNRPSECSHVIGKLYDGDQVALSGRYKHGWAELADGGWVSASWIQ